MSANIIKWDVERIDGLASNLTSQVNDLKLNSSNLKNLKNDVITAWQSVAGTNYTGVLGVNIQELNELINELNELTNNLKNVSKIYSETEASIASAIAVMESQII